MKIKNKARQMTSKRTSLKGALKKTYIELSRTKTEDKNKFTCLVLSYADDLKIYFSISSDMHINNLQQNLDTLVRWCNNHQFAINIKKSYQVTRKRKVNFLKYQYLVNREMLQKKQYLQNKFGVVFDSSLNFVEHVDFIDYSPSKTLWFVMRASKHFQSQHLLKILPLFSL